MGAGRRSVCFESADALSAFLLPESVETKNTFVHFAARDPTARRSTCVGIVTPVEQKPRRAAFRGGSRAVTCKPNCAVAAVLSIPDLRRCSLQSGDASPCRRSSLGTAASPTSPLTCCLETPSLLFAPSPRRQPCASPREILPGSPMAQGFLSPTATTLPSCMSPSASPTMAPQPFPMMPQFQNSMNTSPTMAPQPFPVMPQFQNSPNMTPTMAPQPFPMMPQFQNSPNTTPTMAPQPFPMMPQFQSLNAEFSPSPAMSSPHPSPRASAASDDFFPSVWRTLKHSGAVEAPRQRSRRQKVVLPAQPHELTLMLRHLPLALTPDELFARFEAFHASIDFYYLPTNFETRKNLGYAFLNFNDKAAAARFQDFWKASGIPESDDVCVQDARVQGFAENVERFRNSSVMAVLSEDLKPKIFVSGVQRPFPAAAKPIKPVGVRFRPTGQ